MDLPGRNREQRAFGALGEGAGDDWACVVRGAFAGMNYGRCFFFGVGHSNIDSLLLRNKKGNPVGFPVKHTPVALHQIKPCSAKEQ